MSWQFFGFDIDGSIAAQSAVRERLDKTVDLRQLEQDLRLWGNERAIRKVRSTLRDLRIRKDLRWLTLTGSGDFHHLTSLLIEALPDEFKPLNLVLIDNHPDWTHLPPTYHCGNWVSQILRQRWIDSVVMVGQNSDDLEAKNLWFSPFEDLYAGRLRLYPYSRERIFAPLRWPRQVRAATGTERRGFGTNMFFKTVQSRGIEKVASEIAASLAGSNVYLSIDKDVLSCEYALTDWDQGKLTLPELAALVQKIASTCRLVGADICGEMAPSPLKGTLKLIDSARLWRKQEHDWQTANALNQDTNMKLLDTFTRAIQAKGESFGSAVWLPKVERGLALPEVRS
jgi:arginase family enzyme